MPIPPVPMTQETQARKEGRNWINKKISQISQNAMKHSGPNKGTVAMITDNDGNYNKDIDFKDERHLSQQAMEKIISNLDAILPNKLRDPSLPGKATGLPYRGCYGTNPIGCNFCTQVGHNEQMCTQKNSPKRNRSEGEEEDPKKQRR